MSEKPVEVIGGVDTHRDNHVAAAVDGAGRMLDTASFAATVAGYGELVAWLRSWGPLRIVGVEGTGSYGAGLARHLAAVGVAVVEVNRPNRQARRRYGKSDTADAEAAARAALCGEATAQPKSGDGLVEAIRMLHVARRSALKARTGAINQIHGLLVTAPEQLKDQLTGLSGRALVDACARLRPNSTTNEVTAAAKRALRTLARRHQALSGETTELDAELRRLCAQANPALLAATGVGTDTAATLLVAAGDNPGRMATDASFAALCGASPVQASSGQHTRHRLNRGGNRQANNALWRITMVRLTCDQRTRDDANRRSAEGKTRRDIIRCLKRYIAREIHQLLTNPPDTPHGTDLRQRRLQTHTTITATAAALNTHPTRISALERGTYHNHNLATRYHNHLTKNTT